MIVTLVEKDADHQMQEVSISISNVNCGFINSRELNSRSCIEITSVDDKKVCGQ